MNILGISRVLVLQCILLTILSTGKCKKNLINKEKTIDYRQLLFNFMSMYKLTRQDVAKKLNISTRSVDRYIKAGKLRAKKEGKIVYVKKSDVENLMGSGENKQEVIVDNFKKENKKSKNIALNNNENVAGTLGAIYKDMKEEIKNKDQLIQALSIRVGKAEEIAKNSVSLLDFKKGQYLLEESKGNLENKLTELEHEKEKLQTELKYEKNSNIILIIFVLLLLAIAGTIWFMKI